MAPLSLERVTMNSALPPSAKPEVVRATSTVTGLAAITSRALTRSGVFVPVGVGASARLQGHGHRPLRCGLDDHVPASVLGPHVVAPHGLHVVSQAVGDRYLGGGYAVDLLAEVEDDVELAVWGNVGPGLPAHRHRGSDAVHPVVAGVEACVGQRGVRAPRADGAAVEGQAVGNHGDAVSVLIARGDGVGEQQMGGRAAFGVFGRAAPASHVEVELWGAGDRHCFAEGQPDLDFVANGVAAVLTGVGRYGDGLDGGHGGRTLCVGDACRDQQREHDCHNKERSGQRPDHTWNIDNTGPCP